MFRSVLGSSQHMYLGAKCNLEQLLKTERKEQQWKFVLLTGLVDQC